MLFRLSFRFVSLEVIPFLPTPNPSALEFREIALPTLPAASPASTRSSQKLCIQIASQSAIRRGVGSRSAGCVLQAIPPRRKSQVSIQGAHWRNVFPLSAPGCLVQQVRKTNRIQRAHSLILAIQSQLACEKLNDIWARPTIAMLGFCIEQ